MVLKYFVFSIYIVLTIRVQSKRSTCTRCLGYKATVLQYSVLLSVFGILYTSTFYTNHLDSLQRIQRNCITLEYRVFATTHRTLTIVHFKESICTWYSRYRSTLLEYSVFLIVLYDYM